jgi:hypothetical protein
MIDSLRAFARGMLAAGAMALALVCAPASAGYVTFFGEDLNSSASVPLASFPNASAARASFLASLIGVGTENFEGFADGTAAPLPLNFGAAGNATLSGGGGVINVVAPGSTDGNGRYATSGSHYWEVTAGGGDDFVVTFDMIGGVAAFGFYGIDIGDFGGTVTLTLANGLNTVLNIPNTVGAGGSTDGSVIFFGLIGTTVADLFTSVTFNTTTIGFGETFAFDDMTVGSLEQVNIPEPGTFVLLGIALAGLGAMRRRKT